MGQMIQPPVRVVEETRDIVYYGNPILLTHFNLRDAGGRLVATTMDRTLADELARGFNRGVGA